MQQVIYQALWLLRASYPEPYKFHLGTKDKPGKKWKEGCWITTAGNITMTTVFETEIYSCF